MAMVPEKWELKLRWPAGVPGGPGSRSVDLCRVELPQTEGGKPYPKLLLAEALISA